MNYNIGGDILAKGVNCIVRAGTNPASAKEIGLVRDYTFRKAIQTDKANVVGEILPISIDAVDIAVTLNLSGFIPKKGVDLGDFHTLTEMNADDDAILESTQVAKIPYIDIFDKKTKSIIGSTTWATMTGYSTTAQGKGYVIANCDFESIGFWNGSDYPHSKLFRA